MDVVITGQRLLGGGMPVAVSLEQAQDLRDVGKLAAAAADAQGFDRTDQEHVRLMATSMATSVKRQAGAGRIFVQLIQCGKVGGVELVATGHGPGTPATQTRSGSGSRTVSTDVASLGAMDRVGDLFDVYEASGRGTVMMARLWGTTPAVGPEGRFVVGSMMEPIGGEEVCGDAWAVEHSDGRVVALVADGLGHGVEAAAASAAAVDAFRQRSRESVEGIVGHIHRALHRTRGAAVGVAEVDSNVGRLRFCGIGNIAARLLVADADHHLTSQYGIAGYRSPKIQAFDHEWKEGALLVMHSDGLSSRWELRKHPALVGHHPQLVAATVMRDAGRADDDALVLALRQAHEATGATMVQAR